MVYFWNFLTPTISRAQLKLETSNSACRLTTERSNEKSANLGQHSDNLVLSCTVISSFVIFAVLNL